MKKTTSLFVSDALVPLPLAVTRVRAPPPRVRVAVPQAHIFFPFVEARVLFIASTLKSLKHFALRPTVPVLPFALPIAHAAPIVGGVLFVAHRNLLVGSVLPEALVGFPLIARARPFLPAAMKLLIALRFELNRVAFLQAHLLFSLEKAVPLLLIALTLASMEQIALGAAGIVGPIVGAQRIVRAGPKIIGIIFVAHRGGGVFLGYTGHRGAVTPAVRVGSGPITLRLTLASHSAIRKSSTARKAPAGIVVPQAHVGLCSARRLSVDGQRVAKRFAGVISPVITAVLGRRRAFHPISRKFLAFRNSCA